MANFAAADQACLIRIIKRKLKKIQDQSHPIDGWHAAASMAIEPR